jgi:hypothetical protein
MLTIVEVKLKSVELLFANSTVLETIIQGYLALACSLQLTSMYVARRYYARLKRA